MQKRMLFAGFTAVKKTIIQNWFTPHMCRKTYWIRSLLQIVSCECTTVWVGGARPSTIEAWQCFLFDIRDYIKEWLVLCFIVLPSLPPFWLDLLSMCLLFCFMLYYILDAVLLCVKKKQKHVDNKTNSVSSAKLASLWMVSGITCSKVHSASKCKTFIFSFCINLNKVAVLNVIELHWEAFCRQRSFQSI